QLRPRGKAFEPTAWTADLEPLRRRLAALAPISLPADLPPSPPLAADVPGLVFPLDLPPFGEPGRPRSLPEVREHLVVRFDNQALVSTVLPALSRRYFGAPAGAGYAVSVVPVDDPRRVLFRSDPDLSAAAAPDLRLVMFRLRPFEELRGLWSGGQRTPGRHPFRGPGAHFRQGAWWLLVKHRNGSLEEAVAGFRRPKLAVSLGIRAPGAGAPRPGGAGPGVRRLPLRAPRLHPAPGGRLGAGLRRLGRQPLASGGAAGAGRDRGPGRPAGGAGRRRRLEARPPEPH